MFFSLLEEPQIGHLDDVTEGMPIVSPIEHPDAITEGMPSAPPIERPDAMTKAMPSVSPIEHPDSMSKGMPAPGHGLRTIKEKQGFIQKILFTANLVRYYLQQFLRQSFICDGDSSTTLMPPILISVQMHQKTCLCSIGS